MTKKEIHKTRLVFWLIWTVAISIPASLAAGLVAGSWWAFPVLMTVSTVLAFNYCEWLIKRRQWRAVNTVVLCECAHPLESHGIATDTCWYDDEKRIRNSGDSKLGCLCLRYTPRFWQMSGRT